MKVMMLGWELPPHNSGGLGVACYQLCKSLSKKIDIEFILPYTADHQIDFMKVTAAHPQGVAEILRSGIAYDSQKYILENGSINWPSIHDQQYMFEKGVERIIDGKEFDIVHAHDWLTFRGALRIKELKNCPIILHVHSVESDRSGNNLGNPLVQEIEGLSLHLADKIIAVSEQTKRSIIEDYHVPASKIEVIHNTIEMNEIVALDDDNAYKYLSLMKKMGYHVVVNAGRLTIQKGLPNLLQAAKEVISRVPKTLFLIVGSGDQYYELIELAAALNIGPNVLFADFQRGKNLRDAFSIGDLFVMPSISEPFGLTPLEAIGYGTPVLISKQSGVSEVLNNSLKVDFWDIREMTNKIAAVLMSNELRDELWSNSRAELDGVSWDDASDKIMGLYEVYIGKNGALV